MHPKADPEKRSAFCQIIQHYQDKGRPIVSIDESGFAEDMPRTHGYAPRGKRCYGKQDWGAKGRINVIGALLGGVLLTVSLFSSSINTVIFTSWVEQDLLPKLPPKSVLVLDNATFHKGASMQKTLKDAGHILLYLPAYSPDLNPIEKKWAQAKSIRRRVRCDIPRLFLDYQI
jgi:transposase